MAILGILSSWTIIITITIQYIIFTRFCIFKYIPIDQNCPTAIFF
jgi:hypothetical protein